MGRINRFIVKNIQMSELRLIIVTFFLIIFPFATELIMKSYLPQIYDSFSQLLMQYDSIFFISFMLSILLLLVYVSKHNETEESFNIREKQSIIEQHLKLLTYMQSNSSKLLINEGMCSLFEQKIQILNKQINSEEYRIYPLQNDFFINIKKVTSKIEDKILKVI